MLVDRRAWTMTYGSGLVGRTTRRRRGGAAGRFELHFLLVFSFCHFWGFFLVVFIECVIQYFTSHKQVSPNTHLDSRGRLLLTDVL